MDFAQNLTLPSAAKTPSEWYFLSLISISMFGIHDEHRKQQTNFLYSERKGKKGPNEVISMLGRYIDTREPSTKILTMFADNCGGQNKNNCVLKCFVVLAHTGIYKEVNYNFFTKGHTKNGCDHGFGQIKRKTAKNTFYTMQQLHNAVRDTSTSSESVLLKEEPSPFCDYRKTLSEFYRNINGIQKYQMFQMKHELPGSVICRTTPSDEPNVFDIRCSYDDTAVSAKRVLKLLGDVPPLPEPPVNAEKVNDIYTKIVKYVPAEYRDDPLYKVPMAGQAASSRAMKKS